MSTFGFCIKRGLLLLPRCSTLATLPSHNFSTTQCVLKKLRSSKNTITKEKESRSRSEKQMKDHQEQSQNPREKNGEIELEQAAGEVAEHLPGSAHETKAEIISQLRKLAALTETQKVEGVAEPSLLRETIGSFSEPDPAGSWKKRSTSNRFRQAQRPEQSMARSRSNNRKKDLPERSQDPRGRLDRRMMDIPEQSQNPRHKSRTLFGATPLNIFPDPGSTKTRKESKTLFDILEEEENKVNTRYPPSDGFEEIIRLTEENKTWIFPIDNEYGLDEEAKVSFHEHVFLDHLLKDFPKKGPIRNFMELVVVGLSKNPYITVQQKHEHVAWYREYFKDKYALVDDLVEQASATHLADKS